MENTGKLRYINDNYFHSNQQRMIVARNRFPQKANKAHPIRGWRENMKVIGMNVGCEKWNIGAGRNVGSGKN